MQIASEASLEEAVLNHIPKGTEEKNIKALHLGAQLAKISYAVFLVHHVLIQDMAAHFDLAALSRRDTAFLYVVYLAAAFAAAEALLWLQKTLRRAFAALRPV